MPIRQRSVISDDIRRALLGGVVSGLVVAIGAVVIGLYAYEVRTGIAQFFTLPGTTGFIATLLGGLVVALCAYIVVKRHERLELRRQLFEAVLRQETLQARASGVAALFENVAQACAELEHSAGLQALCDHVRVALAAEQSSIMLLDPDSGMLRVRSVSGTEERFVREGCGKLGEGIAGWVAQHNEPLLLDQAEMERRFPEHIKHNRPIQSALCVPLAVDGEVIGVLNVTRLELRMPFTPEDARILAASAAHVANAIARIGERDEAARALAEREEHLRKAQRAEALAKLAGGVAHEFNNLLTVIMGHGSKLLRALDPADPRHGAAAAIRDAGERAAVVTRQLLAFSRRHVLDHVVLDLNATIRDASEVLGRLVGDEITLVTVLDPKLHRIFANRGEVEHALMNLAGHARDHMPKGGRLVLRTVNIALDEDEAARMPGGRAGEFVLIQMSDSGIGMDEDTIRALFEPLPDPGGGRMRLGLATVLEMVHQGNGFMVVDSAPGQGTTFQLYLPRASEPAIEVATGHAEVTSLAGLTVLLVEDEANVRRLVRTMLENAGIDVLEEKGPGDAVVRADAHVGPIHLMITDVVMPGRSGGELAERMAKIRPGMPVLYMSGYTDDAMVQRVMLQARASFLQKPFSEESLIEKVRSVLERAAAGDAAARRAA